MATTVTSGSNFTTDFFMRNFYKNNPDAFKNSTRKELSSSRLSNEDTRALRRAIRSLGDYTFTEDNKDELEGNFMISANAFVKTYNNALASSEKGDSSMKRFAKQLKDAYSKNKDALDDIGITANKDGTIKLNENLFQKASPKALKEVFGKDASFAKQIGSLAQRMTRTTDNSIYAEMTGSGNHINLKL